MTALTEALSRAYRAAVEAPVPDNFADLATLNFCGHYADAPQWAIGPFSAAAALKFHKTWQWADPTGIGWQSSYIFNPSLIEHEGRLLMFYRAAPKKESLCSRIGLAWSEDGGHTWTDSPHNPIVFPTADNETHGCEDPKIYRHEGCFYLFYQATWVPEPAVLARINAETPFQIGVATDIQLATSTDLIHWEKRGLVVPREVSHHWVKAAVLARNPQGEPVRIGGEFMMFLSEGCGGRLHIGYSADLLRWRFEPCDYLVLPEEMGTLCEVACAVTDHEPSHRELVLDFFYTRPDGVFAGGQALYHREAPTRLVALHGAGGTLSWGGLIQMNGQWLFAQGWDAPAGRAEMSFFTAPVAHAPVAHAPADSPLLAAGK